MLAEEGPDQLSVAISRLDTLRHRVKTQPLTPRKGQQQNTRPEPLRKTEITSENQVKYFLDVLTKSTDSLKTASLDGSVHSSLVLQISTETYNAVRLIGKRAPNREIGFDKWSRAYMMFIKVLGQKSHAEVLKHICNLHFLLPFGKDGDMKEAYFPNTCSKILLTSPHEFRCNHAQLAPVIFMLQLGLLNSLIQGYKNKSNGIMLDFEVS